MLDQKRIRLYTIGLGDSLRDYASEFASSGERVLGHASMATNGRFFFARTSDELKGTYKEISDEMHAISSYYLRPTLSRGQGSLSVVSVGELIYAPSQIEFILDASGSMMRKIKEVKMINIAKDVMTRFINSLPDDIKVALRVYGHRYIRGEQGACQDSELIYSFSKINKPRLIQSLYSIRARGVTPISYALRQVENDFDGASGKKIVILITDGKESCGGSPSEVVSELVEKGFDVQLNIIGFALADALTKWDMQRVAEITGGLFLDAGDENSLFGAIERLLTVPYDVVDAAGEKVAGGIMGQGDIDVPEGIYTVVIHSGEEPLKIRDVRITLNQLTKVELKSEGQEIGVQVHGP
jgi:hypothetical protein